MTVMHRNAKTYVQQNLKTENYQITETRNHIKWNRK